MCSVRQFELPAGFVVVQRNDFVVNGVGIHNFDMAKDLTAP